MTTLKRWKIASWGLGIGGFGLCALAQDVPSIPSMKPEGVLWANIAIYAGEGRAPTIEIKYNPDYGTPRIVYVPMRVPRPIELGEDRSTVRQEPPKPEVKAPEQAPSSDRPRVRLEPPRR